ncbi:hypothetical protein M758_3G210700 [Ceratodon purpureus]|nr:hypothetical protein M758_3G210700 [Ceratodon purpureus]
MVSYLAVALFKHETSLLHHQLVSTSGSMPFQTKSAGLKPMEFTSLSAASVWSQTKPPVTILGSDAPSLQYSIKVVFHCLQC